MEHRRILVIQSGKLGDMVCTTPVFRAIKAKFPNAELVVAGDKVNKDVLAGNPHVDKYVLLSDLNKESIKSLRLDTAVLLTPNPDLLWQLLMSRIAKIIVPKVVNGYSPYVTKKYRVLSLFATRVPHRMHHYAPGEYLRMLVPLGIDSSDTRKELVVSAEVEAKMVEFLKVAEGKFKIAIAPGAGNKIKEWPPARFGEVAKHFIEKMNAAAILIGGPKDKDLGDAVKRDLPPENVVDTIGELSIEELKALIKHVDLFVSADTGPIYIAEAFGIPTVDIIGPVDEREQPPQGQKHLVVIPPGREKPELYVMNARVYNRSEAERLACATPVEAVVQAVESLI